jgi:hypothetical protein
MSMILDGSNGVTFNDASLQGAAASPYVLKNRIINGAMVIDQRNAGASVTLGNGVGTYTLDRFAFYKDNSSATVTSQQSTDAPTNFNNSLLVSVTTGAASSAAQELVLIQSIEGFNVADFGFGAAGASTVTLSFWVRSSLTGTFAGAIANNGASRTYIFTYSISSANTWEQKTITVAGDTTGTWLKTNGVGLVLKLDLGAGSNYNGTAGSWTTGNIYSVSGATKLMATTGATFYITGVQLEKNTSATPFERRLYGQELANCQRYYFRQNPREATADMGVGWNATGTETRTYLSFPTTMRIAPLALEQSGTASDYSVRHGTTQTTCSAVPTIYSTTTSSAHVVLTVSSGLTTGQGSNLRPVNTNAFLAWSAEL